MKKIMLSVVVALGSLAAHGATYYFSDCQAGADTGCTAGNDANAGTSPSAPKRSLPSRALVDGLAAGDQILLAKNGSWRSAVTAFWTGNTKGSAQNPIVIGAYAPTGYLGSAKALITLTANDANCLTISNGGATPVHKEGFTFKSIKCVGAGGSNSSIGVFTYNDVSDVLLEDLDISGFGIGIYPGGGNAPGATTARLTLRNSHIHDNGAQGLYGGGRGLLVEGNTFDNNGYVGEANRPANHFHNIYLSLATDTVLRGNTLTRSAVCNPKMKSPCTAVNQCHGVSLVIHGTASNLIIENNLVNETTGATAGCYGIQVAPGGYGTPENFEGTIVRGNRLVNVGGVAIDMGSAPNSIVENNAIVWNTVPNSTVHGIVVPSGNAARSTTLDKQLTIRNNSIYIAGANATSRGIVVQSPSADHQVVSNLIFFASDSSPSAACFSTKGLVASNFKAFDHNLCYSDRPDHLVAHSQAHATMELAQASGFDVNGKSANPLIQVPNEGNGFSIALSSPMSPARNGGHPTLSSRLGQRGAKNPDASPVIGANPFNSTVVSPSPPVAR